MSDIKYAKYGKVKIKHRTSNFTKDDHTMFEDDVVKDLERKSYLEEKYKGLLDGLLAIEKEIQEEMDIMYSKTKIPQVGKQGCLKRIKKLLTKHRR